MHIGHSGDACPHAEPCDVSSCLGENQKEKGDRWLTSHCLRRDHFAYMGSTVLLSLPQLLICPVRMPSWLDENDDADGNTFPYFCSP